MSEAKDLVESLESGAAALNKARVDAQAWGDLAKRAAKAAAVLAVEALEEVAARAIAGWIAGAAEKATRDGRGGEP